MSAQGQPLSCTATSGFKRPPMRLRFKEPWKRHAGASRDQSGRYLSGEGHSYPISQPRARDISEHSFEYTEEEIAIAGTSFSADLQTHRVE